ncbi:MAG: hypothetical protein U1F71_04395 [Verrucomicrobiaceae bacterium]
MSPILLPSSMRALLLVSLAGGVLAATPVTITHYFDETSQRHLTVQNVTATKVIVSLRWAADPGAAGMWTGNGERRDNQLVFAATVDEGQDRGAFFVAKGEGKLEVAFRPNQKMPQDPGILGTYKHVSDEKYAQLMKKEFQAAEDRLAGTWKNASRTWPVEDKAMVTDWKSRWLGLRDRWMALAYQPPGPPKLAPGVLMPLPSKDATTKEKDASYWLKLAQATAMGYSFMQQPPDMKSKGEWNGEFDDGFGGHVSLRLAKDGKLRVSLSCTRYGELQGMDVSGAIPAEVLKTKGDESTAESVFKEEDPARETHVTLRRKGGFLWLETKISPPLPAKSAWFDGIYRWSPVPTE